jgi:hypothetical protein
MKRTTLITIMAIFIPVAVIILLYNALDSAGDRLASLKTRQQEVIEFKESYMALNQRLNRLEGKKNLTSAKGIVHALDEIFTPLGLKEKVKSVKPLQTTQKGEERAEVSLQWISTNETVNLLYSLQNSPMPITIKKIGIKASFDKPETLNLTMTLSFVKS